LLTEAKHIGNKNENSSGFDVPVTVQQKEEPATTCISILINLLIQPSCVPSTALMGLHLMEVKKTQVFHVYPPATSGSAK